MHRLIAGAVLRPVTTSMVTVALLLFGWVALSRLPIELLPDLSYPTITVQTQFPDAAPVEVEELITRPVEERVGAVPGVVRVESASREGVSEVVLDFAWGTTVDHAMAEVREKLDRVRLPQGADRPLVLRYDPAQEPIVRLALRDKGGLSSLSDADLATLRDSADRYVKRELEKLPGVAAVELHGGQEDEVLVELDPSRLAAHGLETAAIVAALQADNVNQPGGAVTERESRYLVRTLHEARTPAQVGEIIVRSSPEGGILRLRDIAKVRRAPREREELTLVDGREAIELAVFREGDANIVAVSDAILGALPGLPLAPGHEVVVLSNRAQFVESAISEVRDNTLFGGGLAVLVLLFFLRELRSTVVIALAIPISLLTTFIPLQALGVSLNVMSLGGLALGVGMLVDNSIVVLESIARRREQAQTDGLEVSRRQLTVEGASEVASSVVASTLTTVAVFFPMAFVQGVAGQLVSDLSFAVSFSMMSSMAVSLTLVPVLQSLGSDAHGPAASVDPAPRSVLSIIITWPIAWTVRILGAIIGAAGWLLDKLTRPLTWTYEALERQYPKLMRLALRVRALLLIGTVVGCGFAIALAKDSPTTLLPELDQGEFFVQVTLPRDAALERTAAALRTMSDAVAGLPAVERTFTRVGTVSSAGSATGGTVGAHLGQLSVRIEAPEEERAAIEAELIERIRAANPEPDATLQQGRPSLVSFAPPIELLVFSEEPERSIAHARRILPELREVPGLVDVVPDDLDGRPEVRVLFDRERLGRLGLTVDAAASSVQRAIQGEIATKMYAADQQLDVRVMFPRVDRNSAQDVARIQVGIAGGVPVLLSSVAEVEPARGPSEIRRIDGRRGLRISAQTTSVDLGALASRVQQVLEAADDDPSVSAALAGQADELSESVESLVLTAALSIFLVYVVMASSFESLGHPMLILGTVPMALAGVVLACLATHTPLSAMVGIGVIVLGGIVVNNAIVLINAVNDRRGSGLSTTEALIEAGRVRVRPILMTTASTMLGLVPMALGLGDGAALRQPLAIAVIGGLGLSTLLTLVVIPCAYAVFPGGVRDAWRPRPDDTEPLVEDQLERPHADVSAPAAPIRDGKSETTPA